MLDPKLVPLLNKQINLEWYSAYLYLDIYSYYTDQNLNGFGNWFYVQTQEERDHAMLFTRYLLNNSERVILQDVRAPQNHFEDFRTPANTAFEHERDVTKAINQIYSVAYELKDFRTMQFLDWFVKEQGEEEKIQRILSSVTICLAAMPKSLYLLDSELAARVYTPPTLVL